MSKKQTVLVVAGIGQAIWLIGIILFVAGVVFSLPFSIVSTYLNNRWGIKWGKQEARGPAIQF